MDAVGVPADVQLVLLQQAPEGYAYQRSCKAFRDQRKPRPNDVARSEELRFTADEWNSWDEKKKNEVLMNYRIAYLGETMVNWCPKLGTVLANDEVVDGVSERGGYPVVQKKMQPMVSACLCIRTATARRTGDYRLERLNQGDTEELDWTLRRN